MDCSDALRLLDAALERRRELTAELDDSLACYRLVNTDADGFSGLTVDRFGPTLLVEQHRDDVGAERLIDALATRFGEDKAIFYKQRDSREEAQRAGRQVRGKPREPEVEVTEAGLRFTVHLTRGEHTGLFLDARPVRSTVRRLAENRRALNLFSYTGGFGLAAALGGARSTTNVDVKRSALELARRNYALNGAPLDSRTFLKSDVVPFLNRTARGRARYDLVIVDPPPRFRRPGGRKFDAKEGYGRLIARCLKVIEPGGVLLAGLNARAVDDKGFERHLNEAASSTGIALEIRERVEPGVDFPTATSGGPRARFALCAVG